MRFFAVLVHSKSPLMRYACSMVAFVDGDVPFGLIVFPHQFRICLIRSLCVSSAGFCRRFRSRSSASDLADAGRVGWKCRMWPAGRKRLLALFTAFLTDFSAFSTVIDSPALAKYSSQDS